MSRDAKQEADLQFCFEMYNKSKHGSWLADIIRIGGATNIPWPVGMAEAVADLIDKADPWSARDQASSDDTWIMYVYARIWLTLFLRISAANNGPKRFHQNRTVSWLMSMPRSCRRSSTFRSESGNRMYIITARRITSELVLK